MNTTYRKNHKKQLERERLNQLQEAENAKIRQRIRDGTWHDGRLDCVAGNGVMSELGLGDEVLGEADKDAPRVVELSSDEVQIGEKADDAQHEKRKNKEAEDTRKKQRSEEDVHAIEAMPIVILKGFESKGGSARREELLNALATWVAALAENQVAHVIVVSDNRENAKQLARGEMVSPIPPPRFVIKLALSAALPSKPLNTVALSDADASSALKFVQNKLQDAGVDVALNKDQTSYLERVGGRASDLESVSHLLLIRPSMFRIYTTARCNRLYIKFAVV